MSKRQAFGTVVFDSRGRVLLRRPTGCFGGYAWTFAKGSPEQGETGVQAAARETFEETGWSCKVGTSIGSFGGDTSTTEFFLAVAVGEVGVPDVAETEAVAWVTPEAAFGLIDQSTSVTGRRRDRAVLKAALAARGT